MSAADISAVKVRADNAFRPMHQYFADRLSITRAQNRTISIESIRIINLLEAARLADPNHIAGFHALYQNDKKKDEDYDNHKKILLERARCFPFVLKGTRKASTPDRLVHEETLWSEYSAYLILANGTDALQDGQDILLWWADRAKNKQIPAWRMFARNVFSLQPSSAAAERVFSILRSMVDDSQQRALSDLLEATCMRRYNHRKATPAKAGSFADFETNVCEHDEDID